MKKRLLIATGGGDCPGLNAVLRAIVKRAQSEPQWEILGSIDAFNGILLDPMRLVELTPKTVAGIHVQGHNPGHHKQRRPLQLACAKSGWQLGNGGPQR